MTRPFIPVTDELCAILGVDKPGDLPDVVRLLKEELEKRHATVWLVRGVTAKPRWPKQQRWSGSRKWQNE